MKALFPTVLVILDGWGVAPPGPGNAITLARLPFWTEACKKYPSTLLAASGRAVGLPDNQHGNSEAGHLNIGAGRIVAQDAVRINKTIEDGRFFKNPAFLQAFQHAERHKSRVHLMGLLTDEESGHAYPLHLSGLLKLSKQYEAVPVFLHLFTDGRDSPKFEATTYLRAVEKQLAPFQRIATVMGRYWAMDRVKRWSRTEAAYNALVLGQGRQSEDAEQAILSGYKRDESDEFLQATVIGKTAANRRDGRIREHDSIIFFNFRSDRARQLTKVFVQRDFETMNPGSFHRKTVIKHMIFVALTEFGPDLPGILTAFPSQTLKDTLPFALKGLRQLYIAESEKYAHITYFFNGGYPQPVAGEDRVMVASSNVQSFDADPSMKAKAITAKTLSAVRAKKYDFIAMNFANADMVAHTGNLRATMQAVQILDACLQRLVSGVCAVGGQVVITADHGNAEIMLKHSGEIDTEHSSVPVPCVVARKNAQFRLQPKGRLADVAPTVLALLDRPKPRAMTGHSLIVP